jgi:hypothetical protein
LDQSDITPAGRPAVGTGSASWLDMCVSIQLKPVASREPGAGTRHPRNKDGPERVTLGRHSRRRAQMRSFLHKLVALLLALTLAMAPLQKAVAGLCCPGGDAQRGASDTSLGHHAAHPIPWVPVESGGQADCQPAGCEQCAGAHACPETCVQAVAVQRISTLAATASDVVGEAAIVRAQYSVSIAPDPRPPRSHLD